MPTSENTAKKSKPMPKKMLQHFEQREGSLRRGRPTIAHWPRAGGKKMTT